jgi:RimJ/RimL family protein N-acetyltransferase
VTRYDERRTARLLLRRWRAADREPFAAMNADPVVMRHFPRPLTRAESDGFVDRIEARFEEQGFGLWVLEPLDAGGFLGFTGLNPMPDEGVPGAGGMEVGWRLARLAWGHGYATEAALEALRVAEQVGLPEVWSMTAVRNLRSQAVMRRIGLREHALFDHPALPEGHPVQRHVVYHGTLPRDT